MTTKLAYFDGYHWQEVPGAGNIEGWVYELQVYKDELYIGGSFPDIAALGAQGVARYYLHPDSVTWGDPDPISIPEYQVKQLILSPNPTSTTFTFQTNQPGPHTYSIFDITGKQAQNGRVEEGDNVISVEALPAGLYVARIESDGRITRGVIVKQ